jgi:hypothetical protein
VNAEYAASALGGRIGAGSTSAARSVSRRAAAGCGGGTGSVDATLITTTRSRACRCRKSAMSAANDVGRERGSHFGLAAALWQRADLVVHSGQLGGERRDELGRHDTAGTKRFGLLQ